MGNCCAGNQPEYRKNFKKLAANDEQYASIRAAFYELFEQTPCMPLMVRYAWHDAGTYDKKTKTGGPTGSIRFEEEHNHGANAGVAFARATIEDMKLKFPMVTYADMIQIGGYTAIEFAGGPAMAFRFGRTDCEASDCTEDGRLPDAKQGGPHLQQVFGRMGFNDQEIVALSGAHCLGRAHPDRSGFDGAWTAEPLQFDNSYFTELLEPSSEELLRLPTDEALLEEGFKAYVEKYAESQEVFFQEYSAAHIKLSELGFN